MTHRQKMEAAEGQDVALPCTLGNSSASVHVVNIEWTKGTDEVTKVVVYNPMYPPIYYWSNITLQIENNSMGSHLILRGVTRWDSGVYKCTLSTYPLGNIVRETELKIRGKAPFKKTAPHQGLLALCPNCPLHIFLIAADCVRLLLLCPSHQLFNFGANVVK